MPTLIEVEQDLLAVADRIMAAEEAGEPIPEDALSIYRESVLFAEEKREQVAIFDAFLGERADALKAREDALKAQRKAIENFRDRFQRYVLAVLMDKGIRVACGASFKFVVGESESIEVANADALPDELCRIKVVREPDKTSLRLALKNGESIPLEAGVRVAKHDRLQIKPLAVKDRPGDTLGFNQGETK